MVMTMTPTTYRDYTPTEAVKTFIHDHALLAITFHLPNEPRFVRVYFSPDQAYLEQAALERLGETRGGVCENV